MVRVYEGVEGEAFVTSRVGRARGLGSPCDAYAMKVEDSGKGVAWVVYGGDWGFACRRPRATLSRTADCYYFRSGGARFRPPLLVGLSTHTKRRSYVNSQAAAAV